jgi:hypothetical protein
MGALVTLVALVALVVVLVVIVATSQPKVKVNLVINQHA